MKNITLGLDLGTSSIGWALIDEERNTILDAGVKIFQAGVENLGEGENEISRNASRTTSRGTRRQFFRRKIRKNLLLTILKNNGLAPTQQEDIKEWYRINPYDVRRRAVNEKVTLQEIGRAFYHMIQRRGFQSNSRKNSSDDGTIFSGNLKEGKVGINETQSHLSEYKSLGEYLAKLLPEQNQPYEFQKERIRNRYTTRQMYIDEFESIWAEQSKYYPELTLEVKELLGGRRKEKTYKKDGVLFHQRPLKSQKHLLGKCVFEPAKSKCAISHPLFELYRAWQWVNSVECNGKKLNGKERKLVVDYLTKTKSNQKFKKIRTLINRVGSEYQFNYRDDDTVKTCPTIAQLSNKKIFGSDWVDFNEEKKHEIWQALDFYDDKEMLAEHALQKWGLNNDQSKALNAFNLANGYSSLSLKAIKNILPFLEKGFVYDQAVVLGGVKNAFGKSWDNLSHETKSFLETNVPEIVRSKIKGGFIEPLKEFLRTEYDLPEKALNKLYHHSANIKQSGTLEKLPVGAKADLEIQSLRNPVVVTAMFELRRVLNALIEAYGKPSKIKLEMARDLKQSKTKRQEVRLQQKANERFNDFVKTELEKLGLEINYENLLRYKLWLECQKQCPYTGKQIAIYSGSKDELGLFGGQKVVDIEHIHPWSRSINDSFQNKTLCDPDINRLKGDRTPYEFFVGNFGEEEWEIVKNRVLKLFRNRYTNEEYFPAAYNKFKHFVKTKHNDEFTQRHLNDTRFISKEAKNYLGKVCDDITVASGQVTDKLRRFWGLSSILDDSGEKERNDHRHHAIDALTLAATQVKHVQEISKWNRLERTSSLSEFPKPWASFRQDSIKAIDNVVVSYRRNKKVLTKRIVRTEKHGVVYHNLSLGARGQLHKESVFGKRKDLGQVNGFHIRKNLQDLTDSTQIHKIVHPGIQKIILEHLTKNYGIDTSKKFKVPNGAFFEFTDGVPIPKIFLPNKNGEPVPIKRVRIRENLSNAEQLKDNVNQWVNPRNNHHVLLYEDSKGQLAEDVVSFWVVAERKRLGQPVYQLPESERDGKIISTLHINDMFLIGVPEDTAIESAINGSLSEYLYRVQKVSSKDYNFRHHLASKLDDNTQLVRIKSLKKWSSLNPIKVNLDAIGKIRTV